MRQPACRQAGLTIEILATHRLVCNYNSNEGPGRITYYSFLKPDLMTITERLKSPTPSFFKKIRNTGLTLAAISAAILSAPVVWPAMVVTVAGYVGVAGAVASAISQAATENSIEEAATDDRYGVPVPA